MSKCNTPGATEPTTSICYTRRVGQTLTVGAHSVEVAEILAWGARLIVDGALLPLCWDVVHQLAPGITLHVNRADRPSRVSVRVSAPHDTRILRGERAGEGA
jgi:sRNA-binding carbon storage regulator CsrA